MDLIPHIQEIDRLKAEWEQLPPLSEDRQHKLEQKIRMDWNYHSNVIEGNTLTYGETRSLLLYGITANGKSLKDQLDLQGHNDALKRLEALAVKEIQITESLIQEFHTLILQDPFKENPDVVAGEWKKRPNYLYNSVGERIDFVSPEETPGRLNDLINWTNNAIAPPKRKKKQYEVHPLLVATRFHFEFIEIHPFDDGNGRIARIFTNLILMQCGYPPMVIQLKDKPTYFARINQSREEGFEFLALFFAEKLKETLAYYISVWKGGPIEEPEDLDKKIALLQKELEGEMVKEVHTVENQRKVLEEVFIPLLIKIGNKVLANFIFIFKN